MADTIVSPNMNLPVPVVGTAPGPAWATDINACMSTIDGHNHSSSSGVQINPGGININSDLAFNSNNATTVKSVNFATQSAPLTGSTNNGAAYVSGVDLYFNDENGNQIRITQSGSVAGASGTITGLPSGTASASYSAGTFTFQGATSTPATMAVGPLVVGNATASSKTVTISPNAGIASNYNYTLPAGLPGATNYTTLDASGNVGYNTSGSTGSGAVVLATSPTITTPILTAPVVSSVVFPSGTMVDYNESGWVPTFSNFTTVSSVTLIGFARYQQIGHWVYCRFAATVVTTSFQGFFQFDLPITPANNFVSTDPSIFQGITYGNSSSVTYGITFSGGTKRGSASITAPGSGTLTYNCSFNYPINN